MNSPKNEKSWKDVIEDFLLLTWESKFNSRVRIYYPVLENELTFPPTHHIVSSCLEVWKKYAVEFKFNQLSGTQKAFQATWQEHNKRMYLETNGFRWENFSKEQSLISPFILKDVFWSLCYPLFKTWALNDRIKKGKVAVGNQMIDYSIQQHKRHSIGVDSGWLCGGIVGDQRQQKYLSPG